MARAHDDDDSPYHAGERALQEKLGVRANAEQLGRFMLRDELPDEHRAFFAQLPYLLVGSLDGAGRPWASILTGEPGFVFAPDETHLEVHAQALTGDPLADALGLGAPLGILGIQLETRRRNRMNGRVVARTADGFSVRVDQSFGNCPKYISARAPITRAPRTPVTPTHEGARLSAQALACIAGCDTCFLASASSAVADVSDPREGVDVSHRGGRPGFVRVDQEAGVSVLTMPDFSGNNMFNTLGNLTRYPRAGLLFLDFVRGDLLQVTCTTELVLSGPELARFRGAQRLTRFHVEQGAFFPQALPFVWSEARPSPQSEKLGPWQ